MKMLLAAILVLLPAMVQAGECSSDADCPDGYECLATPCTCACEACPDGEECPPCECPDCEAAGECFPQVDDMECVSDEDCPEGLECMLMGSSSSCACADCAPGEECEPCECPEEEFFGYCDEPYDPWDDFGDVVAGACESDADCPVEFLCLEIETPCWDDMPTCAPCACAGCDPDDPDCTEEPDCECPECPDPEPCEEETALMCVFSPTECTVDADCIDGFECVEMEECWGGGGCVCGSCVCPDCPDGAECPPCDCPEEVECECDGEEEWVEECEVIIAICLPKEVPCEADSDCPADSVCMEDSQGTDCACPPCACPDCADGQDCECDCPPCECGEGDDEDPGAGLCVPEGWEEAEFWGGGGDRYGEQATDGKDDPEDPNAPDPMEEGGEPGDGDALDLGGAGSAAADEIPPGGCSTTGGAAGGSSMLLLLALLSLAVTRKVSTLRT
ncbi:MAG: hypothetical protein ABIK09_18125 [Pseudomonadota bacterium]